MRTLLFSMALAMCAMFAATPVAASSYCNSINPPVTECVDRSPRDLLFLVDASNSMNRVRWYTAMLNYVEALYCAFDKVAPNQAGMIIFAENITTVIPLGRYSRTQWFTKVEEIRGQPDRCCSCCTPLAEAFDEARAEFGRRGLNNLRIAFCITDGVPSNNAIGGNPAWRYIDPTVGFNPSAYNYEVVPDQGLALKAAGGPDRVRIFLVGVPNFEGAPPDQNYFTGNFPSGTSFCIARQLKNWCTKALKPPFPIVSLPVSDNVFTSNTWDVTALLTGTVNNLCKILPTPSPTPVPTSNAPTRTPTVVLPTPVPTSAPTSAPTNAPSRAPTSAPSRAPTPGPIAPTFRPSTLTPTRAPTRTPTFAPTRLPTTNTPSASPSKAPTAPILDQLDLAIILDRSNSMNWHADVCQNIIDSRPPTGQPTSEAPCWELYMRYAHDQAMQVSKIKAGANRNRDLGFADDFAIQTTPRKGLRVSVYGFACKNNQKTPLTFIFGEHITSESKLMDVLNTARAQMPFGGTCPNQAIEAAIRSLESTIENDYPLQSAILVTDGVTYDGQSLARAVTGFSAYRATRFSVGIAVAKGNKTFGLTAEEIQRQSQQLSVFADGVVEHIFNLGSDGWAILPEVAASIATSVARDFYIGKPIPRYTWCGWKYRDTGCKNSNWRENHCKWPQKALKAYACSAK